MGRRANYNLDQTRIHSFHAFITNEQLHDQLSRFWHLDAQFNYCSNLTREKDYCGFCDASQNAYDACIYARNLGSNKYHSELLYSKPRVALVKAVSLL